MPNQNLGDSFWMEASVRDVDTGKLVDPDSHEIKLTGPNCNQVNTLPTRVSTGKFKVKLQIPVNGSRGLYTVEWVVIYGSDRETEKYNFVVH